MGRSTANSDTLSSPYLCLHGVPKMKHLGPSWNGLEQPYSFRSGLEAWKGVTEMVMVVDGARIGSVLDRDLLAGHTLGVRFHSENTTSLENQSEPIRSEFIWCSLQLK